MPLLWEVIFRANIGIENIQGNTSCWITKSIIRMEDKRTETEKCNGWLRKMAASKIMNLMNARSM